MTSDQMKISLDWDEILETKKKDLKKKEKSNKKEEPEKVKIIRKISSKSKSSKSTEKIGSEFIDSIKYTHVPGKLSIEISYSLDKLDEDRQGIHVKNLNKEQIQGLKRLLNIFED